MSFLNHNNHRPPKLGAWDIQEILRISPRAAYYHQSENTVYVPNEEGGYNQHTAYKHERCNARYNPEHLDG
jgi:hypothetical protein